MRSFPDESTMPRSQSGEEVIRGGSIGLNRILSRFVERSAHDRNPEFSVAMLSAFTIFRNVVGTYPTEKIEELEEAFVRDVNLFIEYYDTYLAITKNSFMMGKYAVVIVYFPEYDKVDKKILREQPSKHLHLANMYKKFLSRYSGRDELVKQTEHVKCYWVRTNHSIYPHRELVQKFRGSVMGNDNLYSSSDKVVLMSHVPLDYHISGRIRNVNLLESYTGKLRPTSEFNLKLDKEGRIPFNSTTHVVFGDGSFIKSMVGIKIRKLLFEQAVKEKWISRSEDDIRQRISKTADIPIRELRKFDFI